MKNYSKIFTATLPLALGIFLITGCQKNEISKNVIKDENKVTINVNNSGNKNVALYSNLVDEKSQNEIKKLLIESGFSKDNVDKYMDFLIGYNKYYKDVISVKNGYEPLKSLDLPYKEDEHSKIWEKATKDNYLDMNCRTSAYSLYKDFFKSNNKKAFNEFESGEIDLDWSIIKENPKLEFTDNDNIKFHNLYSSFQVPENSDSKKLVNLIQDEWKKRGIEFSENDKFSLINIFMYDWRVSNYFIGHSGILLKNTDGKYIFLEKVGPTLPYQATKFDSKEMLYKYLYKNYNNGSGEFSSRVVFMENNKQIKDR